MENPQQENSLLIFESLFEKTSEEFTEASSTCSRDSGEDYFSDFPDAIFRGDGCTNPEIGLCHLSQFPPNKNKKNYFYLKQISPQKLKSVAKKLLF